MKNPPPTKFHVSRQLREHPERRGLLQIVEVSAGGRDYANPDMVVPKWPHLGEGKEFHDPREAAAAAIAIAKAWKKRAAPHLRFPNQIRRRKKLDAVHVGYGATGGFTMPFDTCSFKALVQWAEDKWNEMNETLPKCDQCGDFLGDETFGHDFTIPEYPFCSQKCADDNYSVYEYQESVLGEADLEGESNDDSIQSADDCDGAEGSKA